MTGLLDTHTFIWWDSEPTRLSLKAKQFIEDSDNTILLSVVSAWEMQIKLQLGKLSLRLPIRDIIVRQQTNGVSILPVTLDHVLGIESLPRPHKDPFDRLLAAQALAENAVLVSADPIFAQYPVPVLW